MKRRMKTRMKERSAGPPRGGGVEKARRVKGKRRRRMKVKGGIQRVVDRRT